MSPFDHLNVASLQGRQGQLTDLVGEMGHESLARLQSYPRFAPLPMDQLPGVGRDLQTRRPSSHHQDTRTAAFDEFLEGQPGLDQVFYGLDREDLGAVRHGQRTQGDGTAGIKRHHLKSDFLSGGQVKEALGGIYPGYGSRNKLSPGGFGHLLDIEADFLRRVGAGQHPGTHAGVIVVIGQADYGYPVASLNDMLQLFQTGQMGMPAAHQH